MRKLIGPHLGGSWASNLEILRKWQPPVALVLQPEVDKVQQLKDVCPNTIVIGRFFHDDSHYASNINARPKEFAHEIHHEIAGNPVTPLLDYVQSNNETNQDWEGIQKLNVYSQEWMFLADQSGLYKCAIMAFSVGNPDLPYKPDDPAGFDGRMLYWQQVLPSLNYAQQKNHILLMHAYGYPDMFHPDAAWYIYRYERQVQANLRTLGITNLKYMYGEIGIDRLIVNGKGGYKVVTNDQDYVNQNLQWERDLQSQGLLLGGAIFTAGDSGGWDTYDIFSTNVASMIAQHYVDHAGDYGSNGGSNDEDNTIFIPAVGTGGTPVPPTPERNIDPRATERGVRVETPPIAPGQSYWFVREVKWYNEQEADQLGPDHHIMVDAQIDGQRAAGTQATVSWPTGKTGIPIEAKLGEPYGGNYPMSPSRNEFSVSMLSQIPSEKVTGIGMGMETPGGFNAAIHTSTGVRFEKRVMAATQPPPPPPVTEPTPMPTLVHPIARPDLRRVTQAFGARPEYYSQFKIDGVPLRGHEGTDFGTPVGSSVVAVAGGRVAEVADQGDKGYGKYIKIVHVWGETVYAHLSDQMVAVGEIVSRGRVIGLSGNTGNSSGPHLHFGLRINPFNRKDGWGGYTNPAPYLTSTQAPGALPPPTSIHFKEVAYNAADQFGVDRDLFLNLLYAENKFSTSNDPSSAGAIGPAQIMPNTWAEWAPKVGATDIRNPIENIRVGAAYLKWCLDRFPGDTRKTLKALWAYNFGYGNVMSGKEIPIETLIYSYSIIHGAGFAKAERNL